MDGPIALPGQWDYSLKSVAKAVGELQPQHRTEYPENLKVGSDAMVMALRAYERGGDVFGSDEFKTIAAYLEVDCRNTFELLQFLRASGEEISSPRAVEGRSTAAVTGPSGWYRCSLAMIAARQDFACRA